MPETGDLISNGFQAIQMAKFIVPKLEQAVAAGTALDISLIRSHLSAMKISHEDKGLCASELEFILWLSEYSLKPGGDPIRDVQCMSQFILMTTSNRDGYAHLSSINLWGDVPKDMYNSLSTLLMRDMILEHQNADEIGKLHIEGPKCSNAFGRNMAIVKVIKAAASHATAISSGAAHVFEGEHAALDAMIDAYVQKFNNGIEIRRDHMPAMSLIKTCAHMPVTSKIIAVPLKECCSLASFEGIQAIGSLDGRDDSLDSAFAVFDRDGTRRIQPVFRAGLGVVGDHNWLENLYVRATAFAIAGVCLMPGWRPWLDTLEIFRAEVDCDMTLLKHAEVTIFALAVAYTGSGKKLEDGLKLYASRTHPKWLELYISKKHTSLSVSLAQRVAQLEQRPAAAAPPRERGAPRDAGPPAPREPAPSASKVRPGCQYSTMSDDKFKQFKDTMNVDLCPFDNGIGCSDFLNYGQCAGTAVCGKSHACPLLSCRGAVHCFHGPSGKHMDLSWRGKKRKAEDEQDRGAFRPKAKAKTTPRPPPSLTGPRPKRR